MPIKTLDVQSISRDRLFYDRYEYCFNFRMAEADTLRELDHAKIDQIIDYRNSLQHVTPNFGGSWHRKTMISNIQRERCHIVCDLLLDMPDLKLVLSRDWVYVYNNDLFALRQLEKLEFVEPLSMTHVTVDRPRDTLLIRNSTYDYRSYFRARKIDIRTKDSLCRFLKDQQDIRISPGLQGFLSPDWKYHGLSDHYFIDHNETGVLLMLELILPRAIRKTLGIIRDK